MCLYLKSRREQSAWMAAMREQIASFWSDDVIDRFMAARDAQPVARPDVHLPMSAARHAVLTLRRASGRALRAAAVLADAPANEADARRSGQSVTCHADPSPALTQLNHLRGESIARLCAAVPPSAASQLLRLLGALVMRGVVSVEPGGVS